MATDEMRLEATDLVVHGCLAGCDSGGHVGIVPHQGLRAWRQAGRAAILAAHLAADSRTTTPVSPEMPLMPAETLEFLLLLSGWVVAFLLGRELQTGFRQWRLRTADQRARRQD
jgi:hypothetical protein